MKSKKPFTLPELSIDQVIRRTIINNQKRATETAAELQCTDRITIVLCGVGSPLATDGAQTCTAVFVDGQSPLFDVGDNAMASMRGSNLPLDEADRDSGSLIRTPVSG